MRDRGRDYAILLAVAAALTLPNLGGPGLWDDDEGVNAQAAREMREADTWVIPTFNYRLRTAKPVLLYWFQRASYAAFGVNEWSARLPSVLCGWLAVLLTYELARRMFGRGTGLVAGVVVASAAHVVALSRAATPDAVLLACTLLTMLAFWAGHLRGGRSWWGWTAAACGLAVMAKGPIGVALPGLIFLLYFAWNRELGRLLDRKVFAAALVFLLVAGPWYGLVASETRGEWLRVFIGRDNVGRFLTPLDGHRGPFWYYLVAFPVLFAPWSAFLGVVVWYAAKGSRRPTSAGVLSSPSPLAGEGGGASPPGEGSATRPAELSPLTRLLASSQPPSPARGEGEDLPDAVRAHRLLVCWAVAYFGFFAVAATKLPNYILPVYPALAILTARFLVAWRDGAVPLPRWVMPTAAGAMVFVGAAFSGGVAFADGALPGLAAWWPLGLVPVAGGVAMGSALRRGDRGGLVTAAAATAVAFVGVMAALPIEVVDRYKAPRELVRASGIGDPGKDVRVGARDWFQPSIVFYAGREVKDLLSDEDAAAFLAVPTPGYLIVPEPVWEQRLADQVTVPHRVAARHYDFLVKCDVLVITNQTGPDVAHRE